MNWPVALVEQRNFKTPESKTLEKATENLLTSFPIQKKKKRGGGAQRFTIYTIDIKSGGGKSHDRQLPEGLNNTLTVVVCEKTLDTAILKRFFF